MELNLPILKRLKRVDKPITVCVEQDQVIAQVNDFFDYEYKGISEFYPHKKPNISNWEIGLIVGNSGTGKTKLLEQFNPITPIPEWNRNKAIVSQFNSKEEAIDRLSNVGLNDVPSWVKPYHVLSVGEQFRANLAKVLDNNICVDEYTSVVDRDTAKSASVAVSRYAQKLGLRNLVFATCHYDVIEWLCPTWVIDTNTGILYDGRLLRRPCIQLDIYETSQTGWGLFKEHHYFSQELNEASRCFIGYWGKQPVGFVAVLPLPHPVIKKAFRGHRTVILPQFQGHGFGTNLSNAVAQYYVDHGYRYFVRTAHPKLGKYRNHSSLWRATVHNQEIRGTQRGNPAWTFDLTRFCYSHEYIGKPNIKTSKNIVAKRTASVRRNLALGQQSLVEFTI